MKTKNQSRSGGGGVSHHLLLSAAVLLFIAAGSKVNAQSYSFTQGDLVISAYGTPASTTLQDGQPVPIDLQEYSITNPNSLTMVESGTIAGIAGEYGSSSEGNIQLSSNDQYLTIAGYNSAQAANGIQAASNSDNGTNDPIGTPYSNASGVPLAQSDSTDVARTADVIDAGGNVVSTTSFSNVYTTNNGRAVYSANGSAIYISGQGDKTAPEQGIFYSPAGASYGGATTATGIYNVNDTRYVTGYNGNLYFSLDKGNSKASKNGPTGIFEFTGLPTSSGQSFVMLTGSTNGLTGANMVSYSPEGFWFANADTLYVADTGVPKNGGTADGGIQKWTLNLSNGTWTLAYTMTDPNFVSPTLSANATSGQTGFEAITGTVVGGTVDLFAVSYTAGDDNANGLYAIQDSLTATALAGQNFTEVESAGGSGEENIKGVSFAPVPEPSSWALLAMGGAGLAAAAWRRRRAVMA
jgi:hypothetical protein